MKVVNRLVEKYRGMRFESRASEFTKYIYVKQRGKVSDLRSKFANEEIQNALYSRTIKIPLNDFSRDNWQLTKEGAEDIKLFYKQPNLASRISSFFFWMCGFDGKL